MDRQAIIVLDGFYCRSLKYYLCQGLDILYIFMGAFLSRFSINIV